MSLPAFQLVKPWARQPTRAHPTDVGWDLFAAESASVYSSSPVTVLVETGLIVQPPAGYYAQILPRSGFSSGANAPIVVPGVIDPGYRGTIKVAMKYIPRAPSTYSAICAAGDRVAQIVFLPYWTGSDWEQKHLADDTTVRGAKGFGSTGV